MLSRVRTGRWLAFEAGLGRAAATGLVGTGEDENDRNSFL